MAAPELPNPFGRYRIVKPLGRGGMGSVYLAHDTQLDRPVALKVPHLDGKRGDVVVERFYREARAAATLDHPNLCPVYDVGEIGGTPYLTMAFVEGRPLADYLPAGRQLPQRQAAALVRKLALALAEAHARGVVHRDLKPDNVMVNQRKEPVIMDFGLALVAAPEGGRLTRTGAVMGTPSYMAPEQVAGDPDAIGPACDVYSLGVMLYEMLTGRLPFEGPPAAVLGQVLVVEPTPAADLRADLDPRLAAVCARAMAKAPADRYASMKEMAAALEEYLRSAAPAGEAPPVGEPRPASASRGVSLAGQLFEDLEPPRTTKRAQSTLQARPPASKASGLLPWLMGAGLLGVLVLTGVAVAIALSGPKEPGTVVLEVNVPGAEVRVDGEVRATVGGPGENEPLRIRLKEGPHELTVTRSGFAPYTESFTLASGQALPLSVKLKPLVAQRPDDKPRELIKSDEKGGGPEAKSGTARPSEPLVVGRWVSIMPTEEEVGRTNFATFKAGALEVRGGNTARGFDSRRLGYEAKNVAIRVEVKKFEGQSIQLSLRWKGGKGYTAFFNGGRSFGIGKSVREGGEWKFIHLGTGQSAEVFGDFFEFTFKAQGNVLTVEADGKEVVRARDSTYTEAGTMGFGPYLCTGHFKKAEVKDLGEAPPPMDVKEKSPPVTPAEEWVSILPTEKEKAPGVAERNNSALYVRPRGRIDTRRKKIKARDAMIRVVVKPGAEGKVTLRLRDGDGWVYIATCAGEGRDFTVHLMRTEMRDGKYERTAIATGSRAKSPDGYFTFTFKAQGDLLTVHADGEEVIRVRDSKHSATGFMGFNCTQQNGAWFKKAEVKVLD